MNCTLSQIYYGDQTKEDEKDGRTDVDWIHLAENEAQCVCVCGGGL